jgi:formamidopyrimidine-DNA glycosylase
VPELPEVETVRRGLNQVTLNQPIQGGDVLLNRTIAHPVSIEGFVAAMTGVAIAQWHRRGKYLLAELISSEGCRVYPSAGSTAEPCTGPPTAESASTDSPSMGQPAGYLGVHLRMTGQLLWVDQAEPLQKHARVRFFFQNQRELRFVDQRTFGQIWWVPPAQPVESIITGLQNLGPEPFADAFSVRYLAQWLKARQRPIKNALLDQALVAGIGNIYADEALFLSGIRPQTLCSTLTRPKIERLHGQVRQVLQASIDARGTTFSDYRDVSGTNGNYGAIAWVYGRDGEPCRVCGTTIERLKLAGRSAHFCPKCQR